MRLLMLEKYNDVKFKVYQIRKIPIVKPFHQKPRIIRNYLDFEFYWKLYLFCSTLFKVRDQQYHFIDEKNS